MVQAIPAINRTGVNLFQFGQANAVLIPWSSKHLVVRKLIVLNEFLKVKKIIEFPNVNVLYLPCM